MSGKLIDGVVAFDETFYERLAKMVNEEPVQTRDLVAMGQLRSIGIEKDKEFKPDDATKAILKEAAQEAHEGFKTAAVGGEPWWTGTQWKLPESIGPKTGFTYQTDDALYMDDRGMIFFLAFALPKKLGGATFYIEGGHDSHGQPLSGEDAYRLHVPPHVPAKQYWAVTVYDLDTACLIRDMPTPGFDSYNQKMHRNGDESVDIYFGPTAPSGQEANWIPTAPNKPWFTMFRFYAPDEPGSYPISRGNRTAISGTVIQVLYDIEFRSTPGSALCGGETGRHFRLESINSRKSGGSARANFFRLEPVG